MGVVAVLFLLTWFPNLVSILEDLLSILYIPSERRCWRAERAHTRARCVVKVVVKTLVSSSRFYHSDTCIVNLTML